MAKQIDIDIIESTSTLKKLLPKQRSITNRSRIKMLLLIQQKRSIYTKDLVPQLKYCRKTIYNWIKLYRDGGLDALLSSNRGGNNTPLIEQRTKEALAAKLSDPSTQITSYRELLDWVKRNYQSNINYATLYKHCRVHHNSVLKVSRKSHHKKDKQAVEAFKKTAPSV
ncbi:MAG: helix-turn-helix domain-containing protein [Bacteroidota bacterium]